MANSASRALAFKQLRSLRRRLRRSVKQMSHSYVPLSMKARNILRAREYIDLAIIMLSAPGMSATNIAEQELRHTTRQTVSLTRHYSRYVLRQLKASIPHPDLAELAETADDAQDSFLTGAKKVLVDFGLPTANRKVIMRTFKKELKGKPFGLSCDPKDQRLALALVGKDPGLAVFKYLVYLRTNVHDSDLIVSNDDTVTNAGHGDEDNDDDKNNDNDGDGNDQDGHDELATDSDYVDAQETKTIAEDTPIRFDTVSRGRHESVERFWD